MKPRRSKEERASALLPAYRQGNVLHNPVCCRSLESALLQFPKSRVWHVIDCVAHAAQAFEDGELYFTPGEQEDVEAEYAKLEAENSMPMLGNWRRI